jgi:oligopeptidase A
MHRYKAPVLVLTFALVCVFAANAAQSSAGSNPLLQQQYRTPFDQIKPEHVEPAITQLLAEAEKSREAFVSSKEPRTYQNTMRAFEQITEPISNVMNVVRHLEGVATTPALRTAYGAVLPKVSAFSSSLSLDKRLYDKIKEFAATPEGKSLTGARKRFVELTLAEFRRNGAELSGKDKDRVTTINVEMSRLTKKFSENVLDATNEFELVIQDEKQLAGLPESARAAARQSAKQKGVEGWRFTLQQPSLVALLTYLDDARIREKMYRASNVKATSGKYDNSELMKRILELRREKARILGFKDFADLVTEDRMAKSGQGIRQFLTTLEDKTRPFYEKENAALLAFRRSVEGPNAPDLAPWDIAYYGEKMRKAKFDFDEEALRPYFPLPGVLDGLFAIANKLYGIRVTRVERVPVWNPGVQYFEIREADGTWISSFYADFHPRDDKRAGAWMNPMLTGGPQAGGFEPHLGLIAANLTAPIGTDPALLTHREVETVFHEFGHLLHHSLSKVPVKSLSGSEVAWDFVELPSQIMENFTWEREGLDLFAHHYKTGERIPEEMYQRLRKSRTFRAANQQMRQLSLGAVDFALHVDYRGEAQDGTVLDYSRKLMQRFNSAPLPPDYGMVASFSHIFAGPVGYAAGYYSYKWAEVLDADAFERFKELGIFSTEAGSQFRQKILEKGNSADPAELFRSFRGRDPKVDALLRRNGLLNSN